MSRPFAVALVALIMYAPEAFPADGKRYALLVGVQKYDHNAFTSPEYAERDVADLAAALGSAGYATTLLTDTTGKKDRALEPTRENIEKALKSVLGKCNRDDAVLVVFAGHGLRSDGKPTAFLCPKDAKPLPDGTDTLISIDALCKNLAGCSAGTKVLLVDACRNSEGIEGDKVKIPDGVLALFSCSAGERAVEHKDLGHSVFFHQILEGLKGKAADGNDAVTFASLATHLRTEVPKQAAKLVKDAKQTPVSHLPESGTSTTVLAMHPQAIPAEEWKEYLSVWSNGSTKPFLEKHGSKHFEAWRKAAEAGSPRGMMLMADCCEFGIGVPKDAKESARWYTSGAEHGNSFAMVGLGMCYQSGSGVKKDGKEAVKWFRKSAELGDPSGMQMLGSAYLRGTGVEKDAKEGVRWLQKSAELGFSQAMTSLGAAYLNGTGVEKDEMEAVKWFRKGSEAGSGMAMQWLGMCYLEGQGVEKDAKEAVKWFRKSADLGHVSAMIDLSMCYKLGVGVEEDEKEAVRWLRKAADLNDGLAMTLLGRAYIDGVGMDVDDKEGVKWLRKAADLGESTAMLSLGVCYLSGVGVEKSRKDAIVWLRKAAALGDAKAKAILKTLSD